MRCLAFYPLLVALLLFIGCSSVDPEPTAPATPPVASEPATRFPVPDTLIAGQGWQLPVYRSFDALAPLFDLETDTTYVVNFWATWCKPCVAELPAFQQLIEETADEPVRVLLVSLDFENQLEKRLLPFVEDRGLQNDVIYLGDTKTNAWIDRVSPEWSGAIPATILLRNGEEAFYERGFTYDELAEVVMELK